MAHKKKLTEEKWLEELVKKYQMPRETKANTILTKKQKQIIESKNK